MLDDAGHVSLNQDLMRIQVEFTLKSVSAMNINSLVARLKNKIDSGGGDFLQYAEKGETLWGVALFYWDFNRAVVKNNQ